MTLKASGEYKVNPKKKYRIKNMVINGSKISIHRHFLTIRNGVVAIKRWTEILLPLIVTIIAPFRVELSLKIDSIQVQGEEKNIYEH